jgi:hypothetical protein
VRVRTIQLRLLGVTLAGLWLAAFGLVLVGYQPGGPADHIVGIAAVGPALVAVAGIVWPPVARGGRAFAAIAWLGIAAALLLVPSLAGLVTQLTSRGPQTLLPSAEAAYPWLLALLATGLFTGLGLARRRLGSASLRRRRLGMGTAIALVLVAVTGTTFAAAAVANELALANRPALGSRFGPTDPALDLPACGDPVAAGATARLQLRLDGSIDSRYTGLVTLDGRRDGDDLVWAGYGATRFTLGPQGIARVGQDGWVRSVTGAWIPTDASRVDGWDTDRQVVAIALEPGTANAPENRGIDYIDGARARHCRIPLDGQTLRRMLPAVALVVGGMDIARWKGELDTWVFADGELGQADGSVSGPAPGLGADTLQAGVRFRMLAFDRDEPITVSPPAP